MAESSSFSKPAIPKFDGFYDHWSMLMENLLRSKEYWNLIEVGVTVAPENATPEQQRVANESKLTDLKVKNYLFQSIDRSWKRFLFVIQQRISGRQCAGSIKVQRR
jgi:hypothetical protein